MRERERKSERKTEKRGNKMEEKRQQKSRQNSSQRTCQLIPGITNCPVRTSTHTAHRDAHVHAKATL